MRVITKKGYEIELTVSGFRTDPKIEIKPFSVGGRKHPGGHAVIQHWRNKGLDRGLYTEEPKAYIEMADMTAIDTAIASLPEKVYYVYREKYNIDADGDTIVACRWIHERPIYRVDGYTITKAQMEAFLEKHGIERVPANEAIKLFADNSDIDQLKEKREASGYRIHGAYRDDVMEEGRGQADENWLHKN